MKTSYSFLPKYAQEDLNIIVKLIRKYVNHIEYIILYGSYARNDYVKYDERIEFGTPTSFMSDYDILVLTKGEDFKEVGRSLDSVDQVYYKRPDQQTPIQFINDDIEKFNSDIVEGRYFYTDILAEGIILYSENDHFIESPKVLNYEEIASQALEYYEQKSERVERFYFLSKAAYEQGWYKDAAFQLHQATENMFYALRLVFTLKNNKQHNLLKLHKVTCKYSTKLWDVFNFENPKEKDLFEVLKDSYVESRYNPDFKVSKRQMDELYPKIDKMWDIAKKVIDERIKFYQNQK